ncbi:MAG: winged-helix domain-containing protein, partial [Acidimicrobiales bacterium]
MAAADKPDNRSGTTPQVRPEIKPEHARRRIPEATVARLPLYLRSLLELNGATSTISSERLAEL